MSTSKLPPVAIESKLQPLSLNKIAEALKAAQLAKLSPLAQKELKNAAWIRIARPEAGAEGEQQSQAVDFEAALEQTGDVTSSSEAATRSDRIEVAQAGPGAGPLMLAQVEAAAGASAGSAGAAAGSAASTTGAGTAAGTGAGAAAVTGAAAIGTTGLLAAVAAVGVAAAAGGSGGGSSSGTTTSTPVAAATTGTVIDGYLKGATVFIDKNSNGKLDSDEVSAITDDKGNFSLPGGNPGRIVAFGGTDISTGLPFKGLLKAPEGSKVITPLTTLVNDLIAKQGSVAKAEEAVLKSLGLGSLDASIDLLNFDPVSAAGGSDAALKSAGLQFQKAGVLVANMVSDLTIKIQSSSGVSDDQLDDIAHDIFSNFANQLTDDALTLTKISALGGALIDDVLNDSTIGGINVSSFKNDLEADKAAYSSNHQGFLDSIDDLTDLAEVGKLQEQNQSAPRLLNASVDGLGDVITLYFDRALDTTNLPTAGQFTVNNGSTIAVGSLQVVNNQVILKLASAVSATLPVKVSFTDSAATNDAATVQDKQGVDARAFSDMLVENRLSLTENKSESFAHATTLSLAGAEISAFDAASDRLFVTSASGLQVIGVDKTLGLTLLGTVALGTNDINSVAVKDGLVAVAVAATDKTQPGTVFFLKADAAVGAGMVQGSVTVGALPDMLTFSADGKKVLVVNEAEQATAATTTAQATVANPEGSVSIIDVSGGVAAAKVSTASFSAFNSKLASLKAAGVRLMAGEAGFESVTVAQDLEPEYLSISPDGKTAFVTLQENNAIAILDIASATFTDIVPLGLKSFLGLPFDGSDRDGAANATAISLRTDQPVFGQYMPDAIASFKGADGRTYFITANEGDDRDDFITPDETARVSALNLDATKFPTAATLKTNAQIGRLTVSNAPGNNGDTDKDGDIDQIMAYGARSFTILNDKGVIVFDSGSHIEQFVSAGGAFTNKDGAGLFDDTRSDNKGPEPEGVTIGKLGDRTLAFVGLERGGGGVMVYDVTDPGAVKFVQHLRKAGDESPEGLVFVDASDSPSDKALLVVTNEVSNTVSVYQNQTDTTAPTLSSALPLDNAASVSVGANLTLIFSEAVKAGSGNIVITNAANTADTRTIAVTDTTQVSFSGGVVTVNPTANLLPGAAYAVTMASGVILDSAGNAYAGISDSTVLNFATASSEPTLLITELNSNAGPEDFFELFNYGSSAINLSGWKWDDDSSSFTDPSVATFAAGTSIAAGGRLLVMAGTDIAGFKTAWGLGSDVQVVSTGGPGLGSGDSVSIFNDGGSVVTSFNYSGTAKTASDGSSVAPSPASAGVTFASGHAGLAYGGTATTSAVWDGLSVTAPTYKAAAVGVDGGVAQAATAANIGSPGSVPALEVGDLLFTAANADPTDALAFVLLQAVAAGTQIGFTDRNFSATTGMPATGESAYLWTADKAYNAGTFVTIQTDVVSGNPLTDKGTVQGAGGGLSTTAETIYAFKGSIASLVDGGAGAITVDKLLASLNVGGAAAGDVPASISSTSLSFTTDNAKFTGSTDAANVSALAALVANPANWTTNDTTAFALTNGSLF